MHANEDLYFNILKVSRNDKIFYEYGAKDTLENKIYIFLIHLSIIFNKNFFKDNKKKQNFFDYIFFRIETDLREIGFGDMNVNKKMKIIIGKFYSILVDFRNYNELINDKKREILTKYLNFNSKTDQLIDYFDNYFAKNSFIS